MPETPEQQARRIIDAQLAAAGWLVQDKRHLNLHVGPGPRMSASHEATKAQRDKEEVATIVVDCAFKLHRDLGPGLLESVYEVVLAKLLQERGLVVERQKPIPIQYAGCRFEEGFRADLILDGVVLVELKSVENLAAVHAKQVLTYLRLMKLPLGLLINFGAATFKEGCQRIVNGPQSFASSRLRVNQNL